MPDVSPYQIIMANRTRTPTLQELSQQVTSLARALVATNTASDTSVGMIKSTATALNNVLPAPVMSSTPRTLNTPFQVSTAGPALVVYNFEMAIQLALLTPQDIGVDLLIDVTNPPTQDFGSAYMYANQTVGVSLTIAQKSREQLVGWVPAGYWVSLVTSGAGGTAALTSQLEVVFH
jgi:hypothetical protein